ncbi:putative alkaline phosphatase [Tolypothrix sp. NIES-4075]|uniref:alkaline phosphatase n=1 Tax=Tolypothrix sp. NIES-4075 TaxID=2005459 RepID=UPI000B5C7EF7|nr:alkaline phosphatase [Tolypothrix sp. NIES-4075]GAX42423.1 putative alkaline phosphatase [Tolypothrix sp. NIES-4075]
MFFLKKQRALGFAATVATTILVVSSIPIVGHAEYFKSFQHLIDYGRAKNVILFIGDGMGDSEITIARNYSVGAAGRLALDTLTFTGEYTTYSLQESNPKLPDYVTDSAASGTGWATGTKTSNGRISTTASTDKDLKTILELAQEKGFVTGDVSTAELTDATPAVLVSHVANRNCQGPTDMSSCPQDKKSAGGPGSIAEQSIDHGVDVFLGGGLQRYNQTIDGGSFAGKTVIESAQAQGYQVVTDAAGLQSAQPDKKVLGLFNSGNMSLEWSGESAVPFPGSGPQRCQENLRPTNEPSLAEMTSKAIELLEQRQGSQRSGRFAGRRGFFLQVEGASIDKRDHAGNPCEQIGETVAFDRAIKVALDYASRHPDTLVVVTADHGHTSQIIPNPTETDHSPGKYSTLTTADGAQMTINYATNLPNNSQEHTGTQVRIAAQGPQAANVVGVIDQTDLFHIMARAIGVE